MLNRPNRRAYHVYVAALLATASTTALAQEVRGPESPQTTSDARSPASTASVESQSAQLASDQSSLVDIIVTARRVSENLQDVPVAVTVFSGEQLQAQSAVRVKDIALLTPGLTIRDGAAARSAPVISLRGQAQPDTTATLDPSIGTYVDGLYWARAYGINADLLDIQSVQTLKGPQGTLFGRNTTGGAILLQTNDPNFRGVAAQVSGTYGRFDERAASGVLNLPIVADRIALRVAGSFRKRDGYITNTFNNEKVDTINSVSARAKLLIQPTDNLSVVLSGEYFRANEATQPFRLGYVAPLTFGSAGIANGLALLSFAAQSGFIDAAGNPNVPAATAALNTIIEDIRTTDSYATNSPSRSLVKTRTFNAVSTLDTFFGAIKFVGGYRRVQAAEPIDVDALPITTLFTGALTGQRFQQDLEQYSGELQIVGKAFNDRLDFAVGALYFHEKGFDGSQSTALPLFNPNNPNVFDGDIDNDSQGIYGQMTLAVTDQLSVTGGLRYSVEDKGVTLRNRAFSAATGAFACSLSGAVPPGCAVRNQSDFKAVDYTASIDYKINDDIFIYAKTAKGFRSGGFNLRSQGNTGIAFSPFEPEVARSYEVGFKSQFLDDRVRLNLAGYYVDLSNIQRPTFATDAAGNVSIRIGNAGKVRIYGGEAELQAILFDGFTLSATGAITRPKYIEYFDGLQDRSNDNYTYTPRYNFSVSGEYKKEVGPGVLQLRADYAYSGRIFFDPTNNPANPDNDRIRDLLSSDPSGILNLRAGFAFNEGRYEIAAFGRNVTSNRQPTVATNVSAPLGFVFYRQNEPATYGLTATLRFGDF